MHRSCHSCYLIRAPVLVPSLPTVWPPDAHWHQVNLHLRKAANPKQKQSISLQSNLRIPLWMNLQLIKLISTFNMRGWWVYHIYGRISLPWISYILGSDRQLRCSVTNWASFQSTWLTQKRDLLKPIPPGGHSTAAFHRNFYEWWLGALSIGPRIFENVCMY